MRFIIEAARKNLYEYRLLSIKKEKNEVWKAEQLGRGNPGLTCHEKEPGL